VLGKATLRNGLVVGGDEAGYTTSLMVKPSGAFSLRRAGI